MKPKLLTALEGYNGRLFLSDAFAGVTVALIALPLSVAIAIASGAAPRAGLVIAIVGGLLIGLPALRATKSQVSLAALGVGLFTVAGIGVLRHYFPWFPGSLLVIAAASAAAALLPLPVDTIYARFGELPAGLPAPTVPHLSVARISELLPSAFVIAFLAAVESLLSAIVADRMIGGTHRSNAELLAQGAPRTRPRAWRLSAHPPLIRSRLHRGRGRTTRRTGTGPGQRSAERGHQGMPVHGGELPDAAER